jgi:hypothetical protein
MRPVLISRCDGVEKPPKKTTPGEAAPGLEPGTSPMQSGALGAWPRCSINSGLNFICIVTARLIFSTNGRTAPIVNRPIGAQNRLSHCHTHKSGRNRCIGVSEKKCLQSSSLITRVDSWRKLDSRPRCADFTSNNHNSQPRTNYFLFVPPT